MNIDDLVLEKRGESTTTAKKALIMLHGRGDSAVNFIELSSVLNVNEFAIIALQADGNTWYPFSFMAEEKKNEPYLSASLKKVDILVDHILSTGINAEKIYFLGFSQGACMALEYTTRNAKRYGGVIAFTGGLIGEKLNEYRYKGDFQSTPVFIGSSDFDPHVPESRINESESIIRNLGAQVEKIIYPGMGHTINNDEINKANNILHP